MQWDEKYEVQEEGEMEQLQVQKKNSQKNREPANEVGLKIHDI